MTVGFNVRGLSDAAAAMLRRIQDERRSVKPRVTVCKPLPWAAIPGAPATVVISGDGWRAYARHHDPFVARKMALAAVGRCPA